MAQSFVLFLFLFYTLLLNWSDINRKSTRHNLLAFSHPLTRFQQRRSHRILLSKNKSDIRVSPQFPWATLGGTQANAGPRLLDMDATRCQIHDGTTCFLNQKRRKKSSPSTGNDDFTTVQHVNRKSEAGKKQTLYTRKSPFMRVTQPGDRYLNKVEPHMRLCNGSPVFSHHP